MQGLAVVPMFVGYDTESGEGRIFSYDVTGGRYEETNYHAVGSGSLFARGALKKLHRPGMSADQVVRVLVQALYDAADDDSATGGPDLTRSIWPVVYVITADGAHRRSDTEVGMVVRAVVEERMTAPDGPHASE
jgi:proteasome beta subunit